VRITPVDKGSLRRTIEAMQTEKSFGSGAVVTVKPVNQSPAPSRVDYTVTFQLSGCTADCCTDDEVDFAVKVIKDKLDKAAAHAKRLLAKHAPVG